MKATRREFIEGTLRGAVAVGIGTALAACTQAGTPAVTKTAGKEEVAYKIVPIGKVEKSGSGARIRIFDEYAEGLAGLTDWSHVNVFYWFDKNDVPQKRKILKVHPQGNSANAMTGVFACRAPVRPNLIALSVCKIVAVEGGVVTVDDIDAFDGTPVIDLKPFIPPDEPRTGVKVPTWTKGKKKG